MVVSQVDLERLRRCVALARTALDNGHCPFGAILIGANGKTLYEDHNRVTDDELRARCREHLAPYKIPVAFHRVDSLPRNPVGKLLRTELAARHAELEREGS